MDVVDHAQDALLKTTVVEESGLWRVHLLAPMPISARALWPWITEPELLARWSPAVPDRPLLSVGRAQVSENPTEPRVDGSVLEVRAPDLLVHRWGSGTLRWEIEGTDGGSILRLEQELDDETMITSLAAGWHLCLAVLASNAGGHRTPRIVGQDSLRHGWGELQRRYAALLGEQS